MSNKRHFRIKNLRDCQRLLGRLINERRRNEIDSQEARDCGYLIKVFVETYEKCELEERIQKLEEHTQESSRAKSF